MQVGGGIGLVDACTRQWGPGIPWGRQYGGLTSNTCSDLPAPIQAGCEWRFGSFFQNADNPGVTYREIKCPSVLTQKSGCVRN